MVEVVGDAVVGRDERERDALRALELDAAFLRPLDREVGRELGERLVEVEHTQADPRERAGVALGLRGEERQLAAPRVGADERELVRAVDDVHAQPVDEEVRQLVPVADPEGDVVEGLDLHPPESTHRVLFGRNARTFLRIPAARRQRRRIGLPIPRRASMLTFGVTVLPDPPHTRFVELMQLAEDERLRVRLDVRLPHPLAGRAIR